MGADADLHRARRRDADAARLLLQGASTDYGPGLVRPHERTHPAAKEDRLRLMRATRANLSPIFSLYGERGEGAAWSALEPSTATSPWGEVTDEEGTIHRLWRVSDQAAIARAQEALAGVELLIADGHHRYETARTYAEEIGGEGEHRYVLMCLVSMSDPGLAIFPTHRLVGGLDEARRRRLDEALDQEFELTEAPPDHVVPESGNGDLPTFGCSSEAPRRPAGPGSRHRRSPTAPSPVTPRATAASTRPCSRSCCSRTRSACPRTTSPTSAASGTRATSTRRAKLLGAGEYELAFLLRPTPVEQVQAIAAAGETMPPKSTYFYPKLLSGLLFNPLG